MKDRKKDKNVRLAHLASLPAAAVLIGYSAFPVAAAGNADSFTKELNVGDQSGQSQVKVNISTDGGFSSEQDVQSNSSSSIEINQSNEVHSSDSQSSVTSSSSEVHISQDDNRVQGSMQVTHNGVTKSVDFEDNGQGEIVEHPVKTEKTQRTEQEPKQQREMKTPASEGTNQVNINNNSSNEDSSAEVTSHSDSVTTNHENLVQDRLQEYRLVLINFFNSIVSKFKELERSLQ